MRPISHLSAPARAALGAHDVIVFDGECVLCTGFFRFMLAHDRRQRFRFVVAQSPLGQRMYRDLGLPVDDFETNLVIVDGRIYERLDAFAAAVGALALPWKLAGTVRFLPGWAKDPLYHRIARNRYRIFGRYGYCVYPTPEVRARFLGQ